MKRILSILFITCFTISTFAKTPQSFKYQAAVRDAQGNPLANKTVSLRIGILAGSFDGQATYSETHQTTTNAFGLVNLEIGKGSPKTGAFAAIDWSTGSYFVKVECDPDGGSNYALLGTSQLLSVPYALYAEKSGNGFSGDYNDLQNKPDLSSFLTAGQINPFSGSYNDLTDKPDLTKYLTTDDMAPGGVPKLRVSRQGDTLSLGKDNYVFIQGISQYNHGGNRMELIEYKITNVQRDVDGDVEITFAYKVRSTGKPEYYEHSDNVGTLYNDQYSFYYAGGQENEFISTGDRLWQGAITRSYENSRYLPAGIYRVWGPDVICYAPRCSTYMAPCEVTIPGGEKPAPKPVVTGVSIYKGHLEVSHNGIGLRYITYTQTEPGKTPENKKIYESGIVLYDVPIGTVFSNFKVTDMFGQTSDTWNGTVTYEETNSDSFIISFRVDGVDWTIDGNEISHVYPKGINLNNMAPVILVSDGATVTPSSESIQDFSNGKTVAYTVTAKDGSVRTYMAIANIANDGNTDEIQIQDVQVKSVVSGMAQTTITLTYSVSSVSMPQINPGALMQLKGTSYYLQYSNIGTPVSIGENIWEGELTLTCGTPLEGSQFLLEGFELYNDSGSSHRWGDIPITIPVITIQNVEVKSVVRNGLMVAITLTYTANSEVTPQFSQGNDITLKGVNTYQSHNYNVAIPASTGGNIWKGEVQITIDPGQSVIPAGEYVLQGFELRGIGSHVWGDISLTVPASEIPVLQNVTVKSVTREYQTSSSYKNCDIKIILSYQSQSPFSITGMYCGGLTNNDRSYSCSLQYLPPSKAGELWQGEVTITIEDGYTKYIEGACQLSGFCVENLKGRSPIWNNISVAVPKTEAPVLTNVQVVSATLAGNGVASIVLSYEAESSSIPTGARGGNLQGMKFYDGSASISTPTYKDGKWHGTITIVPNTAMHGPVYSGDYYLSDFQLRNDKGYSSSWPKMIVTIFNP